MANKLIRVYDLAQKFEVRPATIYQWINLGVVPSPSKVGKRFFWTVEQIKNWELAGYPRHYTEQEATNDISRAEEQTI